MKRMKSQIFRRRMYLFAGILMAILIFAPVSSTKAATYPAESGIVQYEKGKTAVITLGGKDSSANWYSVQVGKKPIYEGITIKSSNQKVIQTEKDGLFWIKVKKAGTSKLTILITKSGKTQKYIMNVKVVKYVNPFKTISVNNKNIKSQLNIPEGWGVHYKVTGNKFVFKSTLEKNWKIIKLGYSTKKYDSQKKTYIYSTTKTRTGNKATSFTVSLKNNQTIASVSALVYNTQTKASEAIFLGPGEAK